MTTKDLALIVFILYAVGRAGYDIYKAYGRSRIKRKLQRILYHLKTSHKTNDEQLAIYQQILSGFVSDEVIKDCQEYGNRTVEYCQVCLLKSRCDILKAGENIS